MQCEALLCRLEYDNGRYLLVVPEDWVEAADLGPGSMVTVQIEGFSVSV